MIKFERVYDTRSSADGKHYLVERLWPRGIKKTSLPLDGREPILQAARQNTVTLLYSSHDTEHNNAVALKKYLERNKNRSAARLVHASVILDAQKRKSGGERRRSSVGGRKLK
jgi:uncharacterized protein YeaO (DUF488 family)